MNDVFEIVALNRYLAIEAKAPRPGRGGEVSGVVLALGWWRPASADGGERRPSRSNLRDPAPPALYYLVSDTRSPTPEWVPQDRVTRQISHLPFEAVASHPG